MVLDVLAKADYNIAMLNLRAGKKSVAKEVMFVNPIGDKNA